jgi:hypothetical protein
VLERELGVTRCFNSGAKASAERCEATSHHNHHNQPDDARATPSREEVTTATIAAVEANFESRGELIQDHSYAILQRRYLDWFDVSGGRFDDDGDEEGKRAPVTSFRPNYEGMTACRSTLPGSCRPTGERNFLLFWMPVVVHGAAAEACRPSSTTGGALGGGRAFSLFSIHGGGGDGRIRWRGVRPNNGHRAGRVPVHREQVGRVPQCLR